MMFVSQYHITGCRYSARKYILGFSTGVVLNFTSSANLSCKQYILNTWYTVGTSTRILVKMAALTQVVNLIKLDYIRFGQCDSNPNSTVQVQD